ncbi:MAG: hypothetical protein OMM_02109 [Candidatus Magnetoglobus multicellularis str. Araruama]|uniref:DUF3971 domain-containing protein n=1 Tax=Candidatus Magnetoglobus multicellularis str. Araruama TaxID=890399 RepID=A0A1V1PAP1_9BACT|nr:MAG: hypothetical protein OMM_02109 [Candidatus Magnetoglobus multicellularis str. Araruama]
MSDEETHGCASPISPASLQRVSVSTKDFTIIKSGFMLKKTILVIAFLLIAATFSMLSLFYYLGSDYILQKVETYLNQQFHGEVNVQRITLNVWQAEINFHHVRLKSLNNQPLAGCQTLCLKLAISSLWSDKIQIKQLHMIRPFLYLPIQGDNPLDFQQVMPFFSIIDHLMTKRIFSLKQAKRTKSLFLQSLNVSDAALFFAQSASDNAFRITHFFLDASQDTLDISGQLSYEGDLIPEMKVLKFQTNGTYPQNNLAQSIITLFSSHSPELFFDRFQDLFQKLRFESQGKIDLTNDFFQHIPTIANKISGRITGEFNINALADAPQMQLSLDYSGEHLNNIPIKKISLTANASDRLITVNEIKMKMPDSQVNIQGIIDLSQIISQGILTDKKNWQNVSYHFIADAKNFPIRHFHPKIPAWSRVNGHVKIKGQGVDCESFQWDIHADGSTQVSQQFHISPDIPVTFQIDAQGVPNMLTVRSLTAQTQGMHLTAYGHINKNMMGSLWINTAVSGKGLSVIGFPEIAADCKTGLTIHRNTTETKANLQLNARKIVFKNYPVGSLLVNASFSQPGQITIHDALLAQGTSKISTSGFVTWDNILHWETSPQAYEISINSNDIQINDWHTAISGTLRVHGLLAGTNQKSTGQIFLDGNALSILGQRIQSIHFPIHVNLNDIQMDAGNIQLSENEAFDISFLLNRQGHYQVDIDSDPIALSRIKWSIPEFQGNFHVNIHGNGQLNQPNINGKLIVSPLLFQNRPLPDAVFQIKTDKEILVIDCQSMLDFHAAYHMKKEPLKYLPRPGK